MMKFGSTNDILPDLPETIAMRRTKLRRMMFCAATLLVLFRLSDDVSADEAEVRDAITAYVVAFNAEDADAIASMWSENASHVDRTAFEQTEGRDAIMADINEVFAGDVSVKLSGSVEAVRMVTPSVASVQGEINVTVGDEIATTDRYSAILIKQDGRWVIDSMEESPVVAPESSAAALSQLDWLIGSWKDAGGKTPVQSVVQPSIGGAFLVRTFRSTTDQGDELVSTQIIGWDAAKSQIRSWTFDGDGSHGEGTWTNVGKNWLVKSSQTLADGRMASGTYVIRPTADDSFTVQLIGHQVDGEMMPSSEVVTVVNTDAQDVAKVDMADETAAPPLN